MGLRARPRSNCIAAPKVLGTENGQQRRTGIFADCRRKTPVSGPGFLGMTPKIPRKLALLGGLSHWSRKVGDWVVVDAVTCEPVSRSLVPWYRENTGCFINFGPPAGLDTRIDA